MSVITFVIYMKRITKYINKIWQCLTFCPHTKKKMVFHEDNVYCFKKRMIRILLKPKHMQVNSYIFFIF